MLKTLGTLAIAFVACMTVGIIYENLGLYYGGVAAVVLSGGGYMGGRALKLF